MIYRNSFVTRFALFFTSLIVVAILLSGYLIYRKSAKVIIENSKERLTHVSDLIDQSFYAQLNEVSNDIAVIASSPTLKSYAFQRNNENSKALQDLFYTVLKNKANYFQIRLIGVEDQGREIIRLDKTTDTIIASRDLQQKGTREYFKETIKMPSGSFYFSEINLNEEHGLVSLPHTPTLRAASPIYQGHNLIGIVIINVNLNTFYQRIEQLIGDDFRINLIDENGQYLYNREPLKMFGQQTFSYANFYDDYNTNRNEISNNEFSDIEQANLGKSLIYSHDLSYFNGKRKLKLITSLNYNLLWQNAKMVRLESIKIIVIICLAVIFVSWLFVNFFSKKINNITKAISNYDKGVPHHATLPTHRNDELGQLARTFTNMREKIDEQVHQLNQSLKKEKKAIAQRDEFLQNMSHELRTPLNTILGLTQILKKNQPLENQEGILNSLERSATNLSGLVHDILDHQKISEGKLSLKMKSLDISKLIDDIYTTYQYEAIQKGLSFKLELDDNLKQKWIITDELRLTQIISNLIINAIKYTQEGQVSLGARIIKNNQLLITIKDSGIGIAQENLDKINRRFYREKDIITGRYGGYGLGLSIVKQLVTLFKGELFAESNKNSGSTFSIKIPIKTSQPTERVNGTPEITLPQLDRSYSILHIEDDTITSNLIKFTLDNEHISLEQISDINLIEIERFKQFDLIISDVMLGENSIKDTLIKLKNEFTIDVPIIIISALETDVLKTLNDYYLQKPFDILLLKDYIFKLLLNAQYQTPRFNSLYINYDYQPQKIQHVLKLLEQEFKQYVLQIKEAYQSKDQSLWQAIHHKIIAHVKNLELNRLESLYVDEINKIDQSKYLEILNVMYYYLCCIRVEQQLNLKD